MSAEQLYVSSNATNERVVCGCTHLTSFAVLMVSIHSFLLVLLPPPFFFFFFFFTVNGRHLYSWVSLVFKHHAFR